MAARITSKRVCGALALSAALIAGAVFPAAGKASPFDPSGVIKVLRKPPHTHMAASRSDNWFGYNQGLLQSGGRLVNSITARWTVPRATQHQRGKAEQSATWIGVGGGCVDAGCKATDPSGLIQTGTEQDISSSGAASYSAWWELVPVPSVTINNMTIKPGDRMYASVAEAVPNTELWTITLQDISRNEHFSTTVPYPSSHATAEWIEETPLEIGTSGTGISSLPKLRAARFTGATVNGKPAALKPAEEIQLYAGSKRIGTPSAPDPARTGFRACAWVKRCPAPRG
jgi:hypothetical protein